jgi:transcriptional regulator with XRE-family HTH domain
MSSDKTRRTSDVWVSQAELDVVLRELRRRRQVTQKQIADEADVSPAAIARLEKGDRRPSLSMLGKLAPVFGTTAEGILEAAERVAAGEQVGAVLDDLPTAAFTPADLPAEVTAGYRLRAGAEASRPMALPPPPTGPRLQVLALAEQLESLEDQDAAIALLRDAIEWLAGSGGSIVEVEQLRRELHELLRGPDEGREPVAAMQTGEVRYVFAHAIGVDEHGHLWIDPLTRARTAGYDAEDPRVERYDDGRIVLDTGRLEQRRFGPRDPDRHRVKVTGCDPEDEAPGPTTDDLEEVYARTIIEIRWPDRSTQFVEPQPEGRPDGDFPEGIEHIHVITAFNPRSRLLRRSENEERNRLLQNDLDRSGLRFVEAVGSSPHSSWSEDSFAVIDADRSTILDLARRYEQSAIFELTQGRINVIWTSPDWSEQDRDSSAHPKQAMP